MAGYLCECVWIEYLEKRHLTWKWAFLAVLLGVLWSPLRSAIAISTLLFLRRKYSPEPTQMALSVMPRLGLLALVGNVIPDYASLLKTRLALRFMINTDSAIVRCAVIVADVIVTALLAAAVAVGMLLMGTALNLVPSYPGVLELQDVTYVSPQEATFDVITDAFPLLWFFPAFFTSIWLWLYAGSGFLLKFARRFDIGFQWFNRHFDIENKPLQSIGLVAGAFVALIYWSAVIVSRLL